jgi:hypothetical protein
MNSEKPNFFKKLKAKAILFWYSIPYTIAYKSLEIERLQILSGIKTLEDCYYSKTKQDAIETLKLPQKEMTLTEYLSALPKTSILKEIDKRQAEAEEAIRKIERLREELEEEAERRKEEEEIEAAYLEHKYNEQRLKLREQSIEKDSAVIKKKNKPKPKSKNEKPISEPKKKSVTKDKPVTTRKKPKDS